jgi:putative ABC transport system permease protein
MGLTGWLLLNGTKRAPLRVLLAAVGVAFPVAILAATLLYVDIAVHSMTRIALQPVRVEMRALATSLQVDVSSLAGRLDAVPNVARVERFAAADVVIGTQGGTRRAAARLFAVDPDYLQHHPWVHVTGGPLAGGALLNDDLRQSIGAAPGAGVTIALPGTGAAVGSVPVVGAVDLRRASTWLAVPTGAVQGDIAVVPRAIVVDYATFQRLVLPALITRLGTKAPVLNPGLTDLPPVDVEAHITIDHASYPSDPGRAAAWSARLQRQLERQAPGELVVADDAAEVLQQARDDATNAKILFLLLGLPGALVAAALGLAAQSALAAAHRREDALLRLRGATESQLVKATAAQAVLAGAAGVVLGLVVAAFGVAGVTGKVVWREVPAGRLAITALFAVVAAAAAVAVRIRRLVRTGRAPDVVVQRSLLERGWMPTWRRARLDLVAVGVGLAILAVSALFGGLRHTPVEGTSLSLYFYVLLAPLALWLGMTLLVVRSLLSVLERRSRPDRAGPLGSWRSAGLRWLARRPARTAVALVLGSLAVAFGTEVIAFVDTYEAAKRADTHAAFGADLQLTPTSDNAVTLPPLGPDVAATTPIRSIPARVGSDRKTIMALDRASYRRATTVKPQIVKGKGVDALDSAPQGVLIAPEIVSVFAVGPGDTLPVVIFPDDSKKSRTVNLRIVGVFRFVPPTEPIMELVISAASIPASLLPAPDTFLARLVPGSSPATVAAGLREGSVGHNFDVATLQDAQFGEQRSLTELNLRALGRLEAVAAALVAGVGVALLGVFLVLERRRELAVLRSLGASTPQLLTGPLEEGAVAVLGSVVIGVPIGLGLSALAVRVLGLFFTLPPPVLALSAGRIVAFVALVLLAAAAGFAVAMVAAVRARTAAVLREP